MMGSFPGMPQSQQGGTGGFPFGGSGGSNNTTGAASLASQLAGLSGQTAGQSQAQGQGGELNLSDFPALGGGQGQQGGAPGLAGLSYATQAGTGGVTSTLRGGASLRNFNQDDFPALNQTGSTEGRTAEDGFPHGVAEQVSAAAALQHQHQQREQHRQSLLGSVVGGARNDVSLSAARGGFGEPDRNYATKLGVGPPGPGLGVQQQTWAPPGSLFGGNNGAAAPNQLNGLQRSSSPSSARSPLSSVRNAAGNLGASSPLTDNASTRADSIQTAAGTLAQPGAMAQTPAQQILTSPADRFGLLGLLALIKSSDPDLSMLSMGVDLQTFGLTLNQSDPLHPSFITPWSENNMLASSRIEPEFTLPSCYNVQPPPPAQSKNRVVLGRDTVFHLLLNTERCVARSSGAGAVRTQLEVSQGAACMVDQGAEHGAYTEDANVRTWYLRVLRSLGLGKGVEEFPPHVRDVGGEGAHSGAGFGGTGCRPTSRRGRSCSTATPEATQSSAATPCSRTPIARPAIPTAALVLSLPTTRLSTNPAVVLLPRTMYLCSQSSMIKMRSTLLLVLASACSTSSAASLELCSVLSCSGAAVGAVIVQAPRAHA